MSSEPVMFAADTYEDAVAQATAHFNEPEHALDVKVIAKSRGLFAKKEKKVQITAALRGDDNSALATDAMLESIEAQLEVPVEIPVKPIHPWTVTYEDDGVFLTMTKDDTEVWTQLQAYLKRKLPRGFDAIAARDAMKSLGVPAKIAPAQDAVVLSETFEVIFAKDNMKAFMTMFDPDPDGERYTHDSLVAALEEQGVRFGIDEAAIDVLLTQRTYNKMICCAYGMLPEKGEAGRIEYHFETTLSQKPVISEEDGTIDFYTLNMFASVNAGDKVATRIPPADGIPGMTVRGEALPAAKGAEIAMPRGSNVKAAEDDPNVLLATVSGRVDLKNGRIFVSSQYDVSGDVDLSVGNIDFEGNVVIRGMVQSGFTVRAKNNIIVGGLVEGAVLEAGGDIILRAGMQGAGKGVLDAGGNITASFVERAMLRARGDIYADALISCKVEAQGSLYALGSKGVIIGGTVRATEMIVARQIGTPAGTSTICEVGALPSDRARLKELEKEHKSLEVSFNRLHELTIIVPGPNEEERPERREQRLKAIRLKMQVAKRQQEIIEEIEQIQQRIEGATDSKIHVQDTVFLGTRLSIASSAMAIQADIHFATFRLRTGDMIFVACEYTDGMETTPPTKGSDKA